MTLSITGNGSSGCNRTEKKHKKFNLFSWCCMEMNMRSDALLCLPVCSSVRMWFLPLSSTVGCYSVLRFVSISFWLSNSYGWWYFVCYTFSFISFWFSLVILIYQITCLISHTSKLIGKWRENKCHVCLSVCMSLCVTFYMLVVVVLFLYYGGLN